MEKKDIASLTKSFDDLLHIKDGITFWFARDLHGLMGFEHWGSFLNAIEEAKIACNGNVEHHFMSHKRKVNDSEIDDYVLTRYGCYLVAKKSDSKAQEIIFAESYFGMYARSLEHIEDRIRLQENFLAGKKLVLAESDLSKLIYEKGNDFDGFSRLKDNFLFQ